MKRNFIFNWYKNEKYSSPMTRETKIEAATPADATSAFMKAFGNLKVNTINFIQEVSDKDEPIGKRIIPE